MCTQTQMGLFLFIQYHWFLNSFKPNTKCVYVYIYIYQLNSDLWLRLCFAALCL